MVGREIATGIQYTREQPIHQSTAALGDHTTINTHIERTPSISRQRWQVAVQRTLEALGLGTTHKVKLMMAFGCGEIEE